jgi:hypothetical protein
MPYGKAIQILQEKCCGSCTSLEQLLEIKSFEVFATPQKEIDLDKALHINNYRLEQKEV